jgi:hypothetical protein
MTESAVKAPPEPNALTIELQGDTQKLEGFLLKKFRKAMQMNAHGDGTPAWKNLFFLLDMMGQGDFYGTVQIKILGCVVKDARIVDRTFKVNEMYQDIESPP